MIHIWSTKNHCDWVTPGQDDLLYMADKDNFASITDIYFGTYFGKYKKVKASLTWRQRDEH